jgi:nickel transport protein
MPLARTCRQLPSIALAAGWLAAASSPVALDATGSMRARPALTPSRLAASSVSRSPACASATSVRDTAVSSHSRRAPHRATAATLVAMALLVAPAIARGHAAVVHVESRGAVVVTARYDGGEPMARAQVRVFAPNHPAEPWLHGVTDADGRFMFVPDAWTGRWSVQVREAGHGAIAHVMVTEATATEAIRITSSHDRSLPQTLAMAASVVWGCIGTALYFRRRGARHASG